MTKAKGYPHKQTFNVTPKPNKRRKAWYRAGHSHAINQTRKDS